jgi:hypothetical protein
MIQVAFTAFLYHGFLERSAFLILSDLLGEELRGDIGDRIEISE